MLRVAPLHGMQQMLCVDWAPPRVLRHGVVMRCDAETELYVSPRVARFAQRHDVTISAWHLGPIEHLVLQDEPGVLWEIVEWERTHPGLGS